jgi:hypothetical protein
VLAGRRGRRDGDRRRAALLAPASTRTSASTASQPATVSATSHGGTARRGRGRRRSRAPSADGRGLDPRMLALDRGAPALLHRGDRPRSAVAVRGGAGGCSSQAGSADTSWPPSRIDGERERGDVARRDGLDRGGEELLGARVARRSSSASRPSGPEGGASTSTRGPPRGTCSSDDIGVSTAAATGTSAPTCAAGTDSSGIGAGIDSGSVLTARPRSTACRTSVRSRCSARRRSAYSSTGSPGRGRTPDISRRFLVTLAHP